MRKEEVVLDSYIWPYGPWAGGTTFLHGPRAARTALTVPVPARHEGQCVSRAAGQAHDTTRARHGQGRGMVAVTLPHHAASPIAMAVAAAADHPRCGTPPTHPVLAPGA
jgi:hypothetical protein